MSEFAAYDSFTRGSALLEAGDAHAAAVALEAAKRLEPRTASIREALGRAYLTVRDFARAADEFAVVIELSPTDHYAHYGLGRALAGLGDAAGARHHFAMARLLGSKLV